MDFLNSPFFYVVEFVVFLVAGLLFLKSPLNFFGDR